WRSDAPTAHRDSAIFRASSGAHVCARTPPHARGPRSRPGDGVAQQPLRRAGGDVVSGQRHTTYEDIERELSSAEMLLHQVRQRRQSLSGARLVLPVIAIITFAAGVAMWGGEREALPLASGVVAVALALLAAGLVVISRL